METTRDYIMKYDRRKQNPIERLHPGEPYFFIRAQDKLSPEAVAAYGVLLKRESDQAASAGNIDLANNLMKQALGVQQVVNRFMDWQEQNADLVKVPD